MPAFYEITFLPGGRVEPFAGSRGNHYEWENGTRLDVQTAPAWCRRCAGITHAEVVETLDEIYRQLADLNDPASDVHRWMTRFSLTAKDGRGEEFRLQQVERLEQRRRWREGRVSPPKCIDCGAADVLFLPLGQPVPHPSRTGTITVEIVGMCSTQFNQWFFTPEGDRIPRDTKPTYWHLPGVDEKTQRAMMRDLIDRAGRRKSGPALEMER